MKSKGWLERMLKQNVVVGRYYLYVWLKFMLKYSLSYRTMKDQRPQTGLFPQSRSLRLSLPFYYRKKVRHRPSTYA